MEKLGGRVIEAGSEAEISRYIEGVVKDCSRVAVSDLVSTQWSSICERLRARGIEIVPALRELAAATRQPAGTSGRVGPNQELPFADEPRKQTSGEAASASNGGLMEAYKASIFEAGAGITTADYAIADTGTLVLLSKKSTDLFTSPAIAGEGAEPIAPRADGEQHRLISLVPPIHVCLLDPKRIVANLTELLTLVHKEFYLTGGPPLAMTFISGPSRTADIELTLTKGVHGPREVHVLLCGR
jgi:L-lactate dehydrogenase complex protein LldG